MGKSFEQYAKGRETEVLSFIELHKDNPWNFKEEIGYNWWPTVKSWYEKHKSPDKDADYTYSGSNNNIYDRTVQAFAKFIIESKERTTALENQNKELRERNSFLEDQLKCHGRARSQELLGVYQMCQM